MPLSDEEVRQLTRIEAHLVKDDRRLNRSMQCLHRADRRLTRASGAALLVAVALVCAGALSGVRETYMAAWFVLLLAMVVRCVAHLWPNDLPSDARD